VPSAGQKRTPSGNVRQHLGQVLTVLVCSIRNVGVQFAGQPALAHVVRRRSGDHSSVGIGIAIAIASAR
jgi:hypothetical protein